MSTAHRDALASAGLIVDEILTGTPGYEQFADILRRNSAVGIATIARPTLDAWTEHAKSALPRLREDVATWVSQLVNHVGVLYELAVAAEAEQATATPAELHHAYLRAFVGYLTPQETVGSRPRGAWVHVSDPLETLAAQALGIRDAVAVERGESAGCEHDEILPRDVEGLMYALGRGDAAGGEGGDEGGDETPPTVN